jgi:collagen beta-1,O-galactosyltransferase
MHVCNREEFGYIPNLDKVKKEERIEEFYYLRMEYLLNGQNKTYNKPLPITKFIDKQLLEKTSTNLGFDKIYIINLERRSDRRERIEAALNELNLEYKIFNAIDAKKIDESYIDSLGIKILPDYKDPYHDRSLNYGEISCFLSHYFIWKEVRMFVFLNVC